MMLRPIVLAVMFTGCGGAVVTTDAGVDAGADAVLVTVDAGASCNTVAQIGSPVDIVEQASDAPTGAAGGTIQTGIYVLTGFTKFTGVGGASGAGGSLTLTIQITSAHDSPYRLDAVYFDGSNVTRASYSAAVGKDGVLDLFPLCPAPGASMTGTYTATGTQLVLQVDSETPPTSETFTKVQ